MNSAEATGDVLTPAAAAALMVGPVIPALFADPVHGFAAPLAEIGKKHAELAFSQTIRRLPIGCGRRTSENEAWLAIQETALPFMAQIDNTCVLLGRSSEDHRDILFEAVNAFIRTFLELAEAWRVGDQA